MLIRSRNRKATRIITMKQIGLRTLPRRLTFILSAFIGLAALRAESAPMNIRICNRGAVPVWVAMGSNRDYYFSFLIKDRIGRRGVVRYETEWLLRHVPEARSLVLRRSRQSIPTGRQP